MTEAKTQDAAEAAPQDVLAALGEVIRAVSSSGFELDEVLHLPHTRLPLVVFIGGLIGCIGGYMLQYYSMAVDYPVNIGGRPLHSWPAFIPVTFECTVLAAALTAVLGMLAMNGLPEPYHPAFNAPAFALASRDRFFLCIEARDPKFDRVGTRQFLETLKPRVVHELAP